MYIPARQVIGGFGIFGVVVLGLGQNRERQQIALRVVLPIRTLHDAELAVAQPADQLGAARHGVLLEAIGQLVGHRGDLVDRRQVQRRLGLLHELRDGRLLREHVRLQVLQRRRHVLGPVALSDEVDQAADLVLGPLDAFAAILDFRIEVLGVVAQVLGDFLADVHDAIGARQALVDRIEDAGAGNRFLQRDLVLTRALGAVRRARVVPARRAADDRHWSAARIADEHAGEQVRGAVAYGALALLAAGVAIADRAQARLRLLPQLRIDDAQLGTLQRDDLGRVTRARHPLVGARRLDPLALLEAPHADVTRVVENRADRRGAPAEPLVPRTGARRRDTLAVELHRDRGEPVTVAMLAEDAAHDLRLAIVDLDPAADRAAEVIEHRNGVEAIWHTACGEAGERAAFEPAERLVAQVIEVDVRQQALDRERELRALRARVDAIGNTEQRYGRELQPLEDRGGVRKVAADARQVFGHDHVDAAFADRRHHRFEPWAHHARARNRVVGEDQRAGRIASALRDVRAAPPELVFDARLPLVVGRESSIDSDVTGLELGMHVSIAFWTR